MHAVHGCGTVYSGSALRIAVCSPPRRWCRRAPFPWHDEIESSRGQSGVGRVLLLYASLRINSGVGSARRAVTGTGPQPFNGE